MWLCVECDEDGESQSAGEHRTTRVNRQHISRGLSGVGVANVNVLVWAYENICMYARCYTDVHLQLCAQSRTYVHVCAHHITRRSCIAYAAL